MKNQYFGDINDYYKYGLLRRLSGGGRVPVSVCWMLTPGDERSDGNRLSYLRNPQRFRAFDPPLFDMLAAHFLNGGQRHVRYFEEANLLPNADYYRATTPDCCEARADWFAEYRNQLNGHRLVFFDPDNGIEVKSRRWGARDSSKYLYWREIETIWADGVSILIYQHFPRKPRQEYTNQLASELKTRLPKSTVSSYRTSNVLFLHVQQPGWKRTAEAGDSTFHHHIIEVHH